VVETSGKEHVPIIPIAGDRAVSAEDADLGMAMAHHAIERSPGAPPRLRPLMFIADQRGSLAGLMIGLLLRKEHLR
jgi:hypothetical protein